MNISFVYYIIAFFFGGCIASAVECAAYRIPRKISWITGRSFCPGCGKTLTAFELIPVISCIYLKNKCSKCGYKFGWYNLLVEAFLGSICVIALFLSDCLLSFCIIIVPVILTYSVVRIVTSLVLYHKSESKLQS